MCYTNWSWQSFGAHKCELKEMGLGDPELAPIITPLHIYNSAWVKKTNKKQSNYTALNTLLTEQNIGVHRDLLDLLFWYFAW